MGNKSKNKESNQKVSFSNDNRQTNNKLLVEVLNNTKGIYNNTCKISDNVKSEFSICRVLISILITSILFGIVYCIIAKVKVGFSFYTFNSFLNNAFFLALLPGCYCFIYYLISYFYNKFGVKKNG